MVCRIIVALVVGLSVGLSAILLGAWTHGAGVIPTYYWAAAGNDTHDCRTPATACQTLSHFNATNFVTGDVVAFNGGDTFVGGLSLTRPMTITSYGTGQPTITSGIATSCLSATNVPNVVINNINCAGGGNTINPNDGIVILNNQAGNTLLAGPTITNSTISGYGADCIRIGGNNGHSAFTGITITGNSVHDCTGDQVTGSAPYVTSACIDTNNFALVVFAHDNQNITVSNNTVFNCTGTHGGTNAAGVGISITNASTVTAASNVIHDSGANSDSTAGPVGIIFAGVTNGLMQFNEVYNMTTSGGDGEGIDFDQNTISSVMQYNYLHHNTFSEILSGDFGAAGAHNNNIIRFNIMEASRTNVSGIHFTCSSTSSGCTNEAIYNNTIYTSAAGGGATGIDVECGNNVPCSFTFSNNIVYQAGANPATVTFTMPSFGKIQTLNLNGNDYFGQNISLSIGGTVYTSLATLHAAGFENVNGIGVGTTADPLLADPGNGGTCGGYSSSCPLAYQLRTFSPAASPNGINLNSVYRYGIGIKDFYGLVAVSPSASPIGASQIPTPPGVSYVGIGDVVSGAQVYVSCQRAYNAVFAIGVNAGCNLIRASDSHTCDITIATSGTWANTIRCSTISDAGTPVATWCNGTTCSITTLYDQTNHHNNITQSTGADRPTISFNCVGTSACAFFNGSPQFMALTGAWNATTNQPFTFVHVSERTGNTSAQQLILTFDDTVSDHLTSSGFFSSANTVLLTCDGSTSATVSANDNVWHARADVCNGASSIMGVDGVTTSKSLGTQNVPANYSFNISSFLGGSGGNQYFTGNITEAAVYPTGFSGTNSTNVCRNQQAYYGSGNFGTVC